MMIMNIDDEDNDNDDDIKRKLMKSNKMKGKLGDKLIIKKIIWARNKWLF